MLSPIFVTTICLDKLLFCLPLILITFFSRNSHIYTIYTIFYNTISTSIYLSYTVINCIMYLYAHERIFLRVNNSIDRYTDRLSISAFNYSSISPTIICTFADNFIARCTIKSSRAMISESSLQSRGDEPSNSSA